QPLDHRGVAGRLAVFVGLGAPGRPDALRVEQVLHAVRHAVERATPASGGDLVVGLFRGGHRLVGHQRDHAGELRVVLREAGPTGGTTRVGWGSYSEGGVGWFAFRRWLVTSRSRSHTACHATGAYASSSLSRGTGGASPSTGASAVIATGRSRGSNRVAGSAS